jgi:tRNA threonylcarbamoyladenosine biosynthesis protein TsaB
MIHILNIETGTSTCSVALSANNNLVAIRELHEQESNHARNLSVFVQEVLAEGEIKATDLNAVAVGKGPGSYTGLRIGVSTAKGICYAAGIPLIAINSLKAMAQGANETIDNFPEEALICSTIDARRMEVYAAIFTKQLVEVMDTQAIVLSPNTFDFWLESNNIYFLGNGTQKVNSVLTSGNARYLQNIKPSARFMIPLAYEMFIHKKFEDVAYFEPFYLKDFVAIKPTNRVLGNG